MNKIIEELRKRQDEIRKSIAPQMDEYADIEIQIQNIEASIKCDMPPPNSNTMCAFFVQFFCSLVIFLRGATANELPCRDTTMTPPKAEHVEVDPPSELEPQISSLFRTYFKRFQLRLASSRESKTKYGSPERNLKCSLRLGRQERTA